MRDKRQTVDFSTLPWLVLRTRSRAEKKVASALENFEEVNVFLPVRKRLKKWSDRWKKVEEPLFSGYLFVQFSELFRYDILNTNGVVRILTFEGKYASIPAKQIEAIRQLDLEVNEIEVVDKEVLVGAPVLIKSGPFKGMVGEVIRTNQKGKLLVEIEVLGKCLSLELGKTKVEENSQIGV
ncbi:MAG: transcriptional antiterminator RfaH [Sediminicola sp.]|jgi:transcriptional antiterminator RfaH